jgi:hypothetical protein
MDRIFWLFINFSHQVVQQLLDQILLKLILGNKIKHLWNELFSCFLIELKCFDWVFGLFVLFGGFIPHSLAFVVLCNDYPLFSSAVLE